MKASLVAGLVAFSTSSLAFGANYLCTARCGDEMDISCTPWIERNMQVQSTGEDLDEAFAKLELKCVEANAENRLFQTASLFVGVKTDGHGCNKQLILATKENACVAL